VAFLIQIKLCNSVVLDVPCLRKPQKGIVFGVIKPRVSLRTALLWYYICNLVVGVNLFVFDIVGARRRRKVLV
jgi:hypothetical protein